MFCGIKYKSLGKYDLRGVHRVRLRMRGKQTLHYK